MVWIDQIHFVADSFAHYLSPVSAGENSYRIIISWSEHNNQMLEKYLPIMRKI